MMRLKPKFVTILSALFLMSFSVSAQVDSFGANSGKSDPRLILSQLKFDSQENLEESRRSLEGALAFDPGNPDYHFELSRVYGALYDESARGKKTAEPHLLNLSQNALEQVLMIRPQDVPALYNLGVIHKRRKNMSRARDEFRRVLKLSDTGSQSATPVSISAWMQIGDTYEEQGFFEDARDAYEKARELGGNRPEVQSALEDLKAHQIEDGINQKNLARNDSWTRQYVGGAEYAQFGSQALKAQSQNAGGVGALVPFFGQMLFQQFMERREKAQRQTTNA